MTRIASVGIDMSVSPGKRSVLLFKTKELFFEIETGLMFSA